jgi:FtsP/CotA-like multicopper oxidase with cupredoxin domain
MKSKIRIANNEDGAEAKVAPARGLYRRLVRPLVERFARRVKRPRSNVEITRRGMMRGSLGAAAGLAGTAAMVEGDSGDRSRPATVSEADRAYGESGQYEPDGDPHGHDSSGTVGDVDVSQFDPMKFLEEFDYGQVSTLPDGRTLREYAVVALDREIEIAPGVFFPAWTYNGQVPGPTFRATAGDLMRVNFTNAGAHPHTIHFHGVHPAGMDGVFEIVNPGESFVYEFEAAPWGCHLYHCHAVPLKRHVHKGLYGAFIVDPPEGRPPAREMVMVMNGFSTEFNGENTFYAVNTVAFHHAKPEHHIRVKVGELQRIYLVNLTEFDLINSFHLHAQMFRLYRTGTSMETFELTDTVMLCQGERAVLEFQYDTPGLYMFHAHQAEFAELGWMGFFEVVGE